METPFKRYEIVSVDNYSRLVSYDHLILETIWIQDKIGVAYIPSNKVADYRAQDLRDKAHMGIAENLLHKLNSQLKNGTFRVEGGGKSYVLDTLTMVRTFNITRYSTSVSGISFEFNGVKHTATLI